MLQRYAFILKYATIPTACIPLWRLIVTYCDLMQFIRQKIWMFRTFFVILQYE